MSPRGAKARQAVEDFIRERSDWVTAAEVAEAVGVSERTARKYLEEIDGVIESTGAFDGSAAKFIWVG